MFLNGFLWLCNSKLTETKKYKIRIVINTYNRFTQLFFTTAFEAHTMYVFLICLKRKLRHRIKPRNQVRFSSVQFNSVQSCLTLCDPKDCSTPGFPILHQLLELAQTHIHQVSDAIQPSHPVGPFSSCLQSFPASGSFRMSQFFTSGGQRIGVSASASVPMIIQDLFPLGWTGWISLQSKGLLRVFSNTTVQKHQFFSTQLS